MRKVRRKAENVWAINKTFEKLITKSYRSHNKITGAPPSPREKFEIIHSYCPLNSYYILFY